MAHTMTFRDDQLELLAEILTHEISSSRQEYRHTDDRDYRTRVALRIDTCRAMLAEFHSALAGTGQYASDTDAG
jgi:hypothetical protein